jgi:Na+-transporting methylmalonyl-CoA/oxaloacetate decarboxylase gamma subunit
MRNQVFETLASQQRQGFGRHLNSGRRPRTERFADFPFMASGEDYALTLAVASAAAMASSPPTSVAARGRWAWPVVGAMSAESGSEPVLAGGNAQVKNTLSRMHRSRQQDRFELPFKYAWSWLQYHTSERLTAFNLFLILACAAVVGYGTAAHDQSWGFALAIAGIGFIVAVRLFLAIVVRFVGFIVAMVQAMLAPRRLRRWYHDREADERKVAYELYGGHDRSISP